MDKQKKEQKPVNIFQRMLEDKRAIRDCIREGGDINALAKARGLKFATPL